jgi:hypothetical protein
MKHGRLMQPAEHSVAVLGVLAHQPPAQPSPDATTRQRRKQRVKGLWRWRALHNQILMPWPDGQCRSVAVSPCRGAMPEAAQLVIHSLIGRLRGEDPHRTSTLRSLSATAVGHSIQAETIALAGLNARQVSAPSTTTHPPPMPCARSPDQCRRQMRLSL